jgi:hypothetical protein
MYSRTLILLTTFICTLERQVQQQRNGLIVISLDEISALRPSKCKQHAM